MTSEVEICNIGLGAIRTATIGSFDESTVQAVTCKRLYPLLRDFVLQDALWGFAHRIEALNLVSDTAFNWAYVYAYPDQCLKIDHLIPNYSYVNQTVDAYLATQSEFYSYDTNHQEPYEIQNIGGVKRICTNLAEARVSYRMRITDTSLFSPSFIMALGHLIGAECAMPIIGGDQGRKLKDDEFKIYQSYSVPALVNSLNEVHTPPPENEFITTRR